MPSFIIGGDFTWSGTTTFSGPVAGLWSTSGNTGVVNGILGSLDNNSVFFQCNGITLLEFDSPSLAVSIGSSAGSFIATCNGGGINAVGAGSNFSIDSDTHLFLGANNAPQITIGTATFTTSIALNSQASQANLGVNFQLVTTGDFDFDAVNFIIGFSTFPNLTVHATDIQMEAAGVARFDNAVGGSGVQIANSNGTHLELGNVNCAIDIACTSFTQAGSGAFVINSDSVRLQTAGTDVFSSDNTQNTVITGSGVSLSSTAGGVSITAVGGFLQLQGTIGSSYTDAANLAFDAPDCNFMRNNALTATIGNTSLATIWNASNMNFTASMNATFVCQTNFLIRAIDDNLTLQGGFSIKLIIPTLPGGNNTPLLIDTDGTIHI